MLHCPWKVALSFLFWSDVSKDLWTHLPLLAQKVGWGLMVAPVRFAPESGAYTANNLGDFSVEIYHDTKETITAKGRENANAAGEDDESCKICGGEMGGGGDHEYIIHNDDNYILSVNVCSDCDEDSTHRDRWYSEDGWDGLGNLWTVLYMGEQWTVIAAYRS